jgi:uncharacterized RDD family membrane protein YckC
VTGARAPALGRRLASALYDLLLTVALAIVATFPFLAVFGVDATQGWRRHLLQLWLVAVAGAYYVWFWTRGGQTLPMKTWRLKLVRDDGGPVGPGRAVHRYAIAVLGLLALGSGFLWAFYDRDGQFLHDRLSGTALVPAPGP